MKNDEMILLVVAGVVVFMVLSKKTATPPGIPPTGTQLPPTGTQLPAGVTPTQGGYGGGSSASQQPEGPCQAGYVWTWNGSSWACAPQQSWWDEIWGALWNN